MFEMNRNWVPKLVTSLRGGARACLPRRPIADLRSIDAHTLRDIGVSGPGMVVAATWDHRH